MTVSPTARYDFATLGANSTCYRQRAVVAASREVERLAGLVPE